MANAGPFPYNLRVANALSASIPILFPILAGKLVTMPFRISSVLRVAGPLRYVMQELLL